MVDVDKYDFTEKSIVEMVETGHRPMEWQALNMITCCVCQTIWPCPPVLRLRAFKVGVKPRAVVIT